MELTERHRQTLFIVVAILALVCFFSSFMLFVCSAYIKANVDARMKLIETYNSDVLPAIFLFVGVINLAQNLICLFVCLKMRNIDNREGLMRMMLPVLIGGIILVVFEVSTAIASFVHITILEDEFETGLKKAMAEYVQGKELKVEMDTVQSEYGCCGDVDYTQWFEYSWLDPQYLKASSRGAKKYFQTDGKYYSDDTPFSCCDVRSPRPCIHHHINDNSRHHNYNFEVETTLYGRGCRAVLMDIYSHVLCTVALIALLIAALKTTALLLFRLLQTSLVAAQTLDDWEATTSAYIYYLKRADPDLEEKKLLDGGGTDSEASKSTTESGTGNETDENTNNETEYDDDGDDDDANATSVYHSNNNYSGQNYAEDVGSGKNISHNKPVWQPLSFGPFSQGTGYLQDTDLRHLCNAGDFNLQNRWSQQNLGFQSGGCGVESHCDVYQKADAGCDNTSSCNDNKFAGVSGSEMDPYKLWTENNEIGSDQRLLQQGLTESGNNGVSSESGGASIHTDKSLMSSEAVGKQVRFEPQKSRLHGDHQGFASKLLSRLTDSLKPQQKYRDSANRVKYSLVSTNSDSEEQEEEEEAEDQEEGEEEDEAEDEEEKEICSSEEEHGKHSTADDTKNKRYASRCRNRDAFEEVQSNINHVIGNNLQTDDTTNSVPYQEQYRTNGVISAHGNERYSTTDGLGNSQIYYRKQLENATCESDVVSLATLRDATSLSSRASMSSYHEVNEKSGEREMKQMKQRNHLHTRTLKTDDCRVSKSKLETRGSSVTEQTTMPKTVSFPSQITDSTEVNVVNSQLLKGLHPSTSHSRLDNRKRDHELSQHPGYNSSTGWSIPNNNVTAMSYGNQTDTLTPTAAYVGHNVHWPTHDRLAELAGAYESSETEGETVSNGSGDDNSSHRHRFVGRYTPYPYEVVKHQTINAKEYDLNPTNIKQSRELTSNNVLQKLHRESSDIAEFSNTDIPESDNEMFQFTTGTSHHLDHVRRNQEYANRQMSHTQAFGKHNFLMSNQQSQLVDGKMDKHAICPFTRQGLSKAHHGRDRDTTMTIPLISIDHEHPKMDVPLEFKSASKPFAFPLMQPSPSSFEMSSSVRNHFRSYQRRSVFLASPVFHSRTNSPLNSPSPHLALFTSPLLDSPMETSTPILCTKRMWDSFKCQTLSTTACDHSAMQTSSQKMQETSRSDAMPKCDSSKSVTVGNIKKNQAPRRDLFPSMGSKENHSPGVSTQLVAVEGTLLIDEVFTSAEVCDVVHNMTTTEQSAPQGRILISPFN